MYIVEFCKYVCTCNECGDNNEYHKVMVFDMPELLQLLNYIDKFEYSLNSVEEECILIGYESFKDYVKEHEEIPKESGYNNDKE